MRIKLYASQFKKDGKTFVIFNKANVRFYKGDSQITLTNLFNGNYSNEQCLEIFLNFFTFSNYR